MIIEQVISHEELQESLRTNKEDISLKLGTLKKGTKLLFLYYNNLLVVGDYIGLDINHNFGPNMKMTDVFGRLPTQALRINPKYVKTFLGLIEQLRGSKYYYGNNMYQLKEIRGGIYRVRDVIKEAIYGMSDEQIDAVFANVGTDDEVGITKFLK